MTKHTPGPWRKDERWDTIKITTDSRVGMVSICEIDVGFDEPFEGEQLANAALIARAPELLEDNDRLRALLRECYGALPSLGAAFDGEQWVEIPHPLKDRIKAAIGERGMWEVKK